MSDRKDLPKIKSEKNPSVLNHEAGKWGFLSATGASFAAIPVILSEIKKQINLNGALEKDTELLIKNPTLNNVALATLGASVVGAIVGGSIEKQKQQQEKTEGHTVKTPGYWNKGILSGLFVNSLLYGVTTYVFKKPLSSAVSTTIGLGSAITGSVIRHNQLKHDFDKAIDLQGEQKAAQQAHIQLLQQQVVTLQTAKPLYKNSLSTNEAQELEEKLQSPPPDVNTLKHAEKHATHTTYAEQHMAEREAAQQETAAMGA